MAKELKQYAEFYGLDELIAEEFGLPLADDDITIMRFAKRAGCTHETARTKIDKLTAAGKLEYLGLRRATSGKKLDAWRVKHAT